MKEKKTISVPESQHDITVGQYQLYESISGEDNELNSVYAFRVFLGIDPEEYKRISVATVSELNEKIVKVLQEQHGLIEEFEIDGVQFGFVPNLEDITHGEYVDAENYMTDIQQLHRLLAVLYRPIVKKNKRFRQIESYKGSDRYADQMKRAPMSVATGVTGFFLSLRNALGLGFPKSSLKMEKSQTQQAPITS